MVSFVDQVVLHLRAGHGGNGCISVRREKFKPLAGPDGGNGGDGGDIVLVADPHTTTLLSMRRNPHRTSHNGAPGAGDMRNGAMGGDVELAVPVGTVVRDEDGSLLADMIQPGMRVVVAPGGRGGLGNAALATSKRKAPGFALLGTEGFTGDISLELKTVADVALVGFPSAGKSSLIAALSAARPKIADYPFTTLHPNLGVVEAGDVRYTVADVPGLIPGASEGKGLGLDFLRHVERCTALVHVLDCATLEPGRDPLSDLDALLAELAAYPVPEGQIPLIERPQLVVLNKIDVPEAHELADLVRPDIEARGYRVFEISAATHQGLRPLSFAMAELVEQHRQTLAEEPVIERIVLRPRAIDDKQFIVTAEGGSYGTYYRIRGAKPERWVQQTAFGNEEAVGFLADRLAKLGVEDELFSLGATPGATVVIGPGEGLMTFDWEPTMTSTAELITGPRGTDARLDTNPRATYKERRAQYLERMDAKAVARAELVAEREAGIWTDAAQEAAAERAEAEALAAASGEFEDERDDA